jgi:peptide deformylase
MKEIILEENQLGFRCDEIDSRKENKLMREIIVELKNVIREKGLNSLAANQIGYDKRIFVLAFKGGNDLRSYINPIITHAKGLELSRESCPSLPGKEYIRPRNNEIVATFMDPLGKIQTQKFVGRAAIAFQHELDHLEGILLSDIGFEVDEDFDNASEDDRAEVIKLYLESLDLKEKDIKKEVEEDEELKQISDAIDFMDKVQKGEIEVEYETVKVEKKKETTEEESTEKEELCDEVEKDDSTTTD